MYKRCFLLLMFAVFSSFLINAQNIDLLSKDTNVILENAKKKLSDIQKILKVIDDEYTATDQAAATDKAYKASDVYTQHKESLINMKKEESKNIDNIINALPKNLKLKAEFTKGKSGEINCETAENIISIIDEEIAKEKSTTFAVPIGMDMQVVNGKLEDTRNASALLGIQFAKEEKFFLSAYLKTSLSDKIEGRDEVFGGFLLEPTRSGTAFVISGNWIHWDFRQGYVLVGLSGRFGVVSTHWEIAKDPVKKEETLPSGYDGNVVFADFAIMIASKTYEYSDGKKFQIGVEIGVGIRIIGDDLGKSDQLYAPGSEAENKFAPESFRLDPRVLGSAQNIFWLFPQITVYTRLNNVCPYVKLAYQDSDDNIRGLSGLRAIFGVKLMTTAYNDTY